MPTFEEQLTKAENVNGRIGPLLRSKYNDDRRLTLPLAYLNLSLDHHRAIIALIRAGLYGSAMALVRLVFEAMIRSHWVAKCATDAQVEEVAENDDFRFPKMDDMAKAVDAALSDPNDEPLSFFQRAKADAWKASALAKSDPFVLS